MKAIEYDKIYKEEWNDFVKSNYQGRFCNLTGFNEAIRETFGFSSHCWMVKENDEILALMSAFECRDFLGRKKMISQPFSEYGGILIKDGISQAGTDKILENVSKYFKDFLASSKIGFLEVHGGLEIKGDFKKYFEKFPLYQYAVLELDSPENLFEKKFNYEVKKAIKKAERSQVSVFHGLDEKTIKEKFYPLYLLSMKRLGSPPHHLRYFLNLSKSLKDSIEFFWAEHQGRPTACLLGWKCGQRIQITDTVSDFKQWETRANDLLHWEFIKWASLSGFKYFDFGPVRYEGQERYKKKWGCDFFDYSFYYLSSKKGFYAKKPLDDRDFPIKLLSAVWKKLIPVKLTPILGGFIRKKLGR
ncbi:MAG: GNAT family N-acetyltransferase [Candidatus Pacebacteria bacterium]|nr:GNAT family N-acetyltransferase [Candidatus Paceibacterota bacterium]